MKGSILFCIALLLYTGVVFVAESAEMGLAGAWLFDEESGKTVKDIVGGNDGEIKGSVERVANGKIKRALKFPGKGDSYVSIPHKDILDSEPYTITAWTKLENTGGYQYIAWKNGLVWPEPHAKRHIDIWVRIEGPITLMWSVVGDGAYGRIDGVMPVADGKWHHVAKSCDGKTVRLYIDATLDGEKDAGGKLAVNGEDPLWIGARPGDVAATGLFDEVGFFTEALSEDELTEVKDGGLANIAAVSPSRKLAITWGKVKFE